ncbi:hypothetical protein P5673_028145 [Acropora cervicornis]|uniref:Uncharacterized protein n=1 Tax=Acropora cervicornis TaxID=6130 RepID=A0AAD9PXX6_ACRCE|nr:hypothetical protein P5673_028145 [Acropora cervicornis]
MKHELFEKRKFLPHTSIPNNAPTAVQLLFYGVYYLIEAAEASSSKTPTWKDFQDSIPPHLLGVVDEESEKENEQKLKSVDVPYLECKTRKMMGDDLVYSLRKRKLLMDSHD